MPHIWCSPSLFPLTLRLGLLLPSARGLGRRRETGGWWGKRLRKGASGGEAGSSNNENHPRASASSTPPCYCKLQRRRQAKEGSEGSNATQRTAVFSTVGLGAWGWLSPQGRVWPGLAWPGREGLRGPRVTYHLYFLRGQFVFSGVSPRS